MPRRLKAVVRLRALLAVLVIACTVFAPSPARGDTASLNAFLSTYHADVGSSVPLGDGRVLWLFGDTIRPDGTWEHNSAVVQEADGGFTPLPGTFAPASAPGHWYWPGQAVVEGDRLHVLAMDFTGAAGSDAWGWRFERTDVLTYQLPDLRLLSSAPVPGNPSGAMFSQLHQASDGHTYIYGSYSVPGHLGKAVQVARVPNGQLASTTAWEYVDAEMGPELELGTVVSVVPISGGGYRLFSKRLDLWSEEIVSYDSPTPYGPWTNRRIVATAPHGDGRWTYGVEAHPEQPEAPGALVLTYATNCDRLCGEYHLTAITVAAP